MTAAIWFTCAIVLLSLAGCGPSPEAPATPAIDIPVEYREHNWGKNGSCCHATIVTLLHYQGRHREAEQYRASHTGGSWDDMLDSQLERAGIKHVQTSGEGQVEFLALSCELGLGCGIQLRDFYDSGRGGMHMVALVHFDDELACVIDSNYPNRLIWFRSAELAAWWVESNSWAVALLPKESE